MVLKDSATRIGARSHRDLDEIWTKAKCGYVLQFYPGYSLYYDVAKGSQKYMTVYCVPDLHENLCAHVRSRALAVEVKRSPRVSQNVNTIQLLAQSSIFRPSIHCVPCSVDLFACGKETRI